MDPDQSLAAALVIIFAVTYVGLTALMVGVTTRAASGRLARNQWVGIRTPSTMGSDQAWVAGHRAATRSTPFFVMNTVVACAVFALGLLGRWSAGGIVLVGVCFFATFTVISVWTAVAASRAATSIEGEGG
ncbi:SdpI family protein [Mycolicibacterium sp. 22603]|uniref:SdpI family protein n=1 Tax=Mycolicibacterium sp. 22603 TaxID=3453950 RepID=UPI003F872757